MIFRPVLFAAILGMAVAVAGAAVLSPQRYATVAAQNLALWLSEQKTAIARLSATPTPTANPLPSRTPTRTLTPKP